jgi:hypothetical protein
MSGRSNYALERSVKGLAQGAAGAGKIVAPAAPGESLALPAQRGRYTDFDGTYA